MMPEPRIIPYRQKKSIKNLMPSHLTKKKIPYNKELLLYHKYKILYVNEHKIPMITSLILYCLISHLHFSSYKLHLSNRDMIIIKTHTINIIIILP